MWTSKPHYMVDNDSHRWEMAPRLYLLYNDSIKMIGLDVYLFLIGCFSGVPTLDGAPISHTKPKNTDPILNPHYIDTLIHATWHAMSWWTHVSILSGHLNENLNLYSCQSSWWCSLLQLACFYIFSHPTLVGIKNLSFRTTYLQQGQQIPAVVLLRMWCQIED